MSVRSWRDTPPALAAPLLTLAGPERAPRRRPPPWPPPCPLAPRISGTSRTPGPCRSCLPCDPFSSSGGETSAAKVPSQRCWVPCAPERRASAPSESARSRHETTKTHPSYAGLRRGVRVGSVPALREALCVGILLKQQVGLGSGLVSCETPCAADAHRERSRRRAPALCTCPS
eukprot:scaffold942_cov260-Pinguiococcus_pyrenoidosus.AAC.8